MIRRMTYARPERLIEQRGDRGTTLIVREPQHPTRPARPYEVNVWREESDVPANPFHQPIQS